MDDLISRSKLLDTIDQNARFYGLTSANKLNFMDIVRRQEAVYAEPKWISVKDRLPEANKLVLCIWLGGRDRRENRGFATYQQHGVWYVSNEGMPEVTHWMPLPEAPKEE